MLNKYYDRTDFFKGVINDNPNVEIEEKKTEFFSHIAR